MSDDVQALVALIKGDDVDGVGACLSDHPELSAQLDEPVCPWNMPMFGAAQSSGMVDLLLREGAELGAVSQWWSRGFAATQVGRSRRCFVLGRTRCGDYDCRHSQWAARNRATHG